jgi:hypothetical protein
MSLERYSGEENGKIYTYDATPGDNTPGSDYFEPVQYSWAVSSKRIELNFRNSDRTNFISRLRYIWNGDYRIEGREILSYRTTDISIDWQELALGTNSSSLAGWSYHYATPTSSVPSPQGITENGATINYKYSTTGVLTSESSLINNYPLSISRDVINKFPWADRLQDGWWDNQFAQAATAPVQQTIDAPLEYGISAADTITNFNPKENDKLQIELSTFQGSVGKLNIAKKTKQVAKLAKKDVDFIYDQQAGYLYYNENGKEAGFGDGGIFAILEGKPKVGLGNFEFV